MPVYTGKPRYKRLRNARPRFRDPVLDHLMPSITKGLLLNVPMRFNNKILYSADGQTDLTTETVSDKGMVKNWKDGLLDQAIANVVRTEPTGWRVEGTRTNLFTYSEDASHANWVKSATTVLTDQATSPDGATGADKITETAATTWHYIYQEPTVVSGTNYVISAWCKAGTAAVVRIELGSDGFTGIPQVIVDLSDGSVVSQANNNGYGVEAWPGGWYRVWVTATADANTTTVATVVIGSTSHAGDTGQYLYSWGRQFEAGTRPSSYIPTTTASAQRAADSLQIDNTGAVHCLAAQGTIAFAFTVESLPTGTTHLLFDSDDATPDGVDIRLVDTTLGVKVHSGGGDAASFSHIGISVGTHVSIVTYAVNDFRFYIDGGNEKTDSSGAAPAVINTLLSIGRGTPNLNYNAYATLAHLLIYDHPVAAGEVKPLMEDYRRWMPWL